MQFICKKLLLESALLASRNGIITPTRVTTSSLRTTDSTIPLWKSIHDWLPVPPEINGYITEGILILQ